jgi:hypothetical protein
LELLLLLFSLDVEPWFRRGILGRSFYLRYSGRLQFCGMPMERFTWQTVLRSCIRFWDMEFRKEEAIGISMNLI